MNRADWKKKRRASSYFKSEKYKATERVRSARYQRKNRIKVRCRKTVWYALRIGRLLKPDHCTRCGLICKPEAHHPDYSKPLEVVWACKPCHGILDAESCCPGR